jgi:WD40 repeat protein
MVSKHLVLKGHSAPIYAVTSDQNFIYSSSGDKIVTRWNKISGEQDSFVVRLDEPAYSISIYEELLLVGTTKGTVYAINTSNKSVVWERNLFGFPIFSIEINPDLKQIYVGDAEGNLIVFNSSGDKLISLPLNSGKIRVLLSNGNQLYVGSNSGKLIVLDELTFNQINQIDLEIGISCFFINEKDNSCHIGLKNAHLFSIQLQNGQILKKLPLHHQTIYGIELFGSILVTVSMDKTMKFWDRDTFNPLKRIELKDGGHSRSINGIHRLNEFEFVTFSDDKTIILWQLTK